MASLTQHLAFVNEQISAHDRLAARYRKNEERSALHLRLRDGFRQLLSDMTEVQCELDELRSSLTQSKPLPKQLRLSLSPEDVEGLPDELMAELSYTGGDKTEFGLIQVIDEAGGVASLDQILVGHFRKTGEVMKRTTLTSRLYRMANKGLIFPLPNKKGVYSTSKFSDHEVAQLLGADSTGLEQNGTEGDEQ